MKDESPRRRAPHSSCPLHEGGFSLELLGSAAQRALGAEERDRLVREPLHEHAERIRPALAGPLELVGEPADLRALAQRPVDLRLERNVAGYEGAGHRHQRDLAEHRDGGGVGRERLGDVERVLVVHDDVDHLVVPDDDGLLAPVGFDREGERSDLQT